MAKMARKNDGVVNVMPTAVVTVPTSIPAGDDHPAMISMPTAIVTSAAAPRASGGSRSATLANAMRPTTTVIP